MECTTLTIVNLPKLRLEDYTLDNKLVRRTAERNRELRLYALQTAPEAFGSSYETEIERPLDQTIERLKMPQADHFFGVDGAIAPWTIETNEAFFETLLTARWVGMLVLIGPLSSSGSLAISSKRDPLPLFDRAKADLMAVAEPKAEPLHYHINGAFVDPECRRAGLGQGLIEAALNKASAEAIRRGQQLHCTILVNFENTAARRLYEKMGFRATGEESYFQRPRLQLGEYKGKEQLAVKMELTRSS